MYPIHEKPMPSFSFDRLDTLWKRYPQYHERTTFGTIEDILQEHESYQKDFDEELRDEYLEKVRASRVTLLDNESLYFHGVRIGGLSSAKEEPDLDFLERFAAEDGYKLLMCHHPEIYRDYVSGKGIDLTLCGHAHGGQIQLFGRGLYAPGQGLFPKLTHGLHDGGKMLISRGMTNGAKPRIPRINNPCELIILNLERTED